MDVLQEFLDPVPLPIMILVIFGLILFVTISKFFRLPENFAIKEEIREEIKFRLFYKDMEEAAKAAKTAEKSDPPPETAPPAVAAGTDGDAPAPAVAAEPKP